MFDVAERSVKLLLNSYFKLFMREYKLSTCEFMQVSTKKIPSSYDYQGDLINLINTGNLSDILLTSTSILKIPPISKKIEFVDNSDTYSLYLDIVPSDIIWNDQIFNSIENVDNIKKCIGNCMNMAHYVFAYLKNSNVELSTIILEANPDNVTLMLKDTRVPNYVHSKSIGFKLTKINYS